MSDFMDRKKHIIIIGGGAAGMVAGILSARNGSKVTIIEQQSELGKKLLVTGNGRCNLTNLFLTKNCFYSTSYHENSSYLCGEDSFSLDSLLETYSPQKIIDFFQSIGILTKDRNGYVYPLTDQASSIKKALISELESLHVTMLTNTLGTFKASSENSQIQVSLTKLEAKNEKPFNNKQTMTKINTSEKEQILVGDALIISTGGKSGITNKNAQDGYFVLKNMKHRLTNLSPALVPIIGQGDYFKKLSGIRTEVNMKLWINHELVKTEGGELQLTDYGISGIPVFQISRIITQELKNKQVPITVELDFMPRYNTNQLLILFNQRRALFGEKNMEQFMNGLFHDKLGSFLLKYAGISEKIKVKTISEKEYNHLLKLSKSFPVDVKGSKDFLQSQVTAGGIPLTEVKETLESKYHKNVYFTGEILDVDGICGGYNLHFAWASAMHVVNHIYQ